MRNPKNILRHELIGLECEVVDSKNKSNVGIKGKIIDETMKTVVIRGEVDKVVQKKDTVFRVILDEQKVNIDGNFIIGRPEDRIKKKFKKW